MVLSGRNIYRFRSSGGWIFIVSISDWVLYKNAYIQLLFTIVLSLALFSIIIMLYVGTIRSRERAEQALRSCEEFLSRITGEFIEPLKRILRHSDRESLEHTEDYEDAMADIHSAGMRLNEMLSQIMSFKKPFVPEVLTLRVRHMIDLDHLQRKLEDEVEKKTRENERLFLHVVSSLASAIDAKDTYSLIPGLRPSCWR